MILAQSLRGCPAGGWAPGSIARLLSPLLVVVSSEEVLLDGARRFAEAVSDAAGTVNLDIYDGMPHAFRAWVLGAEPLPTALTLIRRITEWGGSLAVSEHTI